MQDKFKENFKKYKVCKDGNVFKGFKEIFDVDNPQHFIHNNSVVKKSISELREQYHRSTFDQNVNGLNSGSGEEDLHLKCQPLFGLTHPSTWEIYEFDFPKGLIFVKNPFTSEGQRYWISKCLTDYPQKPHITNIDNLKRLKQSNTNVDNENTPEEKSDQFYKDLRWTTFGYHHSWDNKVYSEDNRCKFPTDLATLTKYMSIVLGYQNFAAEAAIVNYYHLDSTLSGHVDRSEKNQYAPLFSLSFGQTCVFLIGAETKDKTPLAVYLKSGDVVVMTGPSRLSYHGVPKILSTSNQPWNSFVDLKSTTTTDDLSESSQTSPSKKLKLEQDVPANDTSSSCPLCNFVKGSEFNECDSNLKMVLNQWSTFHETYASKSRINLNVRQVLFPGQTSLDDQHLIGAVS